MIDDSELMMERSKSRGEEMLMKKREILIADIEKCRKRLDGFNECSDMAAIDTYLKEVCDP